MRQENIGTYVWFGTCVRYLQDVETGHRIHETQGTQAGHVLFNIDAFFRYLSGMNLQVTSRAAYTLRSFREEIAVAPPETVLTAEQASRLQTLMTDLRKTLEAELAGSAAYIVSPKRLDTGYLIERVDQLFAPDVYAKLPDIARADFAEGGKCIAFERPTAAAFHVLRGTESVLRSFYCQLVRQKRVSLMWGNMVADLRKRRAARGYEVLLNHLDNIRSSFRNPTAHPEKFFDIQEAQDLWSLCVDAVNRMARAL